MPVIYIDVLIALNLFIDYLLLSVTARILRRPHKGWRMVMGSVLGSLSSCLIFLPDISGLLSVFLKLAAAALIIKVVFTWTSLINFVKELLTFFVSSTVFAGISFAVWYFIAPEGFYVVNGVVYYDISPLMLVFLTVCSYAVLCLYDRFTHKKMALGSEYRLLMDFGGGMAGVKALYDTGNHLTENFSGSPVAVVKLSAVDKALPDDLRILIHTMESGQFPAGGEQELAALQRRIRMIPYHSVGGNGLLPAVQPMKMNLISASGKCIDVTGAYVALTEALGRGGYEALIGTELVSGFDGNFGRRLVAERHDQSEWVK